MKLSILFDLDDTLLKNKMEDFLPLYLHGLQENLASFRPSSDVPKAVLEGTAHMIQNLDPDKTLEESFDEVFYGRIEISKEDLRTTINNFYDHIFPQFASVTQVVGEAQNLIRQLNEIDVYMVVATNPLFPKAAVLHRLNWADLGVPAQRFRVITSYEDFHFAKPNLAYYAEIMAHLGWPERPAVMIGNDWDMDIVPAEKLGLPTFFLGTPPLENDLERDPRSSQGNWSELSTFLTEIAKTKDPIEVADSDDALVALLSATAAYIDHLRRKKREINYWQTRPEPKEWSLIEIISHLADVDAEVNLPRLQIIKEQTTPFFAAIETDQWAEEHHYLLNDPGKILDKFIDSRKKLIAGFSNMSTSDRKKVIQHSIFGPTTVSEIFKFIVQHDRIHLNQINKVITAVA